MIESFLSYSFGLTSGNLKATMKGVIAMSAVVHKYGEVLSTRTEDGSTLRAGATSRASSGRAEFGCSGILRASGILSEFAKCCAE
jgi:hypothetical protein